MTTHIWYKLLVATFKTFLGVYTHFEVLKNEKTSLSGCQIWKPRQEESGEVFQ